jgi:hypothetical protein
VGLSSESDSELEESGEELIGHETETREGGAVRTQLEKVVCTCMLKRDQATIWKG